MNKTESWFAEKINRTAKPFEADSSRQREKNKSTKSEISGELPHIMQKYKDYDHRTTVFAKWMSLEEMIKILRKLSSSIFQLGRNINCDNLNYKHWKLKL